MKQKTPPADVQLVEVYRAKNVPQAHILRSALEEAGIRVFVEGEMLQAAMGEVPFGWQTAPRLMVAASDFAQARELIGNWERAVG